jgi:hypothetical protein
MPGNIQSSSLDTPPRNLSLLILGIWLLLPACTTGGTRDVKVGGDGRAPTSTGGHNHSATTTNTYYDVLLHE